MTRILLGLKWLERELLQTYLKQERAYTVGLTRQTAPQRPLPPTQVAFRYEGKHVLYR
jgi:hypothetical protein